MKNNTRWVIVDTETDGLYEPIHVVEIAAQAMEGWDPSGPPFQVFLNHGVPIPPEATAIHGYTQRFLKRHGIDPSDAHARFGEYVSGCPLVCHNISYDWNRALVPEWERLGCSPIGTRGFCTMLLARRTIHETRKYNLEILRSHFGIRSGRSHHAAGDVDAVVQLFTGVIAPRLAAAGIDTFGAVQAFTRRTPIRKCLSEIMNADRPRSCPPPLPPRDEWYVQDADDQPHGPHPAGHIWALAGGEPCYVWQEGMPDWAVSTDVPQFMQMARNEPEAGESRPAVLAAPKSMGELLGLCKGLMATGRLANKEVFFLSDWLGDADFLGEWPASELAEVVEGIVEDNVITKEEKAGLAAFLEKIV